MKFDQLSYFLETARLEHIGKASKVLAISPSAISHSISSLEEEIGHKLFQKKGKNIFLTDHGRLLRERATILLQHANAVKEELVSDNVDMRGHYRVAASHLLSSKILTPAWSRLQKEHEMLVGEIMTRRSSEVIKGVLEGDYDLGICFSPQPHPDIERLILFEGQLGIFVRRGHPFLKSKGPISSISKYRAALPKAFQGIDVCESNPMLKKFKIEPHIDCMFDSYEVACEKLLTSNSWCLMPDFVCKYYGKHIQSVKLPKNWNAPYDVSAIYSKNRYLTKPLRALLDYIENAAM